MSALAFIFFYLAMFVNAIVFSALGQGGGTLYTPIQIFFGIEFHTAATTSLFLIMVTSLSSTLVFRKAKVVDWFMAFAFVSATTIGAFLGGMYSGHFTGRFLTYLFAAVMALAGVFMVRQFGSLTWSQAGGRRFYLWERHAGEEHYCINLALALPLLFCSGSIAGLIGVSGGILNVPMMVLLLGVPMSALMVGLTSTGGFTGHMIAGHINWPVALALAPGMYLAGQIGPRKAVKVDKQRLKVYFGWFLFALAALLVVRTAMKG